MFVCVVPRVVLREILYHMHIQCMIDSLIDQLYHSVKYGITTLYSYKISMAVVVVAVVQEVTG